MLIVIVVLLNINKTHIPNDVLEVNQTEIPEEETFSKDSTSENDTKPSLDNSSDEPADNVDSNPTFSYYSPYIIDIPATDIEDIDNLTAQEDETSTTSDVTEDWENPEIDEPILEPYDYTPLFILGPYEFGGHITKEDLTNIGNMYNNFIESKGYIDLLEIPSDDYGDYNQILKQIDESDNFQRSNPDLVSAEECFQNALDRLFCYGKYGKIQVLEQAAISAETAVEYEDVIASGSYNNFINYAKTGVIAFFCVLDSEQPEYDSGTAADVEFRIAKLLYRSSTNLLNIDYGQRYYSLCTAYWVSQDAYINSYSEGNYAVDIAFYHLKICSDMLSYAESEEFQNEIGREAMGVYEEFNKRVEECGKLVNKDYVSNAEEILNKINRILGYDTQEQEEIQSEPAA